MYEKKSKYENNSQEICQLMVIQTGSPRPTQSSRPSVSFLHPVITTKQSAWRDLLNLRRRYFGFAKRKSRRDYCIGDIGYLDGTEDNLVLQEVADFFY